MIHIPLLLWFVLGVNLFLPAENPEPQMKPEITSFYYLKDPQLQNFSFFISSDEFQKFQKEPGDSNRIFPLKVVWTRKGKVYYILQPFDDQDDTLNQQEFMKEVLNIRQKFREFYEDWDYFLISSPLSNLPDSVKYSKNGDTLTVKYWPESSDKGDEITLQINVNGLLTMQQERFAQEKIVTRPLYQSREEGQVCIGWDSERSKNDSLIAKSTVRFKLAQNMPYPVPSRADIKTVLPEDTTQHTALYFHHYEFNFPLEELELPDSSK